MVQFRTRLVTLLLLGNHREQIVSGIGCLGATSSLTSGYHPEAGLGSVRP